MGTGCIKIQEPAFLIKKNMINVRSRSPKRSKRSEVGSIPREFVKRRSIFAKKEENYIEAEAANMIVDVVKTVEDKSMILKALNSHFIFISLSDEDKEIITNSMDLYAFTAESFVFMQGMPSKSFYVTRTGSLSVIVNGKTVNKISQGEGFGELALLQDNLRSASLKCLEPTTL